MFCYFKIRVDEEVYEFVKRIENCDDDPIIDLEDLIYFCETSEGGAKETEGEWRYINGDERYSIQYALVPEVD